MTRIDVLILAFTVVLALVGARQGFVVGALTLAGFVLGAVAGTRLGPLVLADGARSPYAPLFGLVGALVVGGLLAAGLGGLGERARSLVRLPGFGVLDAALGAALSAALALGLAWVGGAAALQVPGGGTELRRDVQRSEVLRRLNAVLPPSGPILNALARIDPLPTIDGPRADVAPPRAAIARTPGVRRAEPSVVRVLGTACGLGVEGSGWVVAPGLVVTNAHVVAGQDDTVVQERGTGPRLEAEAVAFDPGDDLAVLRVPELAAPALALADDAEPGTAAAVLGFPGNGPFDVRAGRIGTPRSVLSQDAYGRGPVRRTVVPLRGRVRGGNSGGPMVDARGRVVTTVFAATVDGGAPGGFGVPNDAVREEVAGARGPVSTGPCAR